MKKAAAWVAGALLFIILLVIAVSFLVEKPLRDYVEKEVNKKLEGYEVSIRKLDLHLLTASVDFEGVLVIQKENPVPPVAEIPEIDAGLHWTRLLKGRLVGDILIKNPKFYLNLNNLRSERKDDKRLSEKGWEKAAGAAYPFKINRLRVTNGELVYIDKQGSKPLNLSSILFEARNIRNIDAPDKEYPSLVHMNARVFDKGSFEMNGEADFISAPGLKAYFHLNGMDLGYLQPVASRHNAAIRGGTFDASGFIETTAEKKIYLLDSVILKGLDLDYMHSIAAGPKEKEVAKEVKQEAKEAAQSPDKLLKIEKLSIEGSTIGFINKEAKPDYRVFFSAINGTVANFSNRFAEGPATVDMKGKFMGSGPALLSATFRPEAKGPDFDLAVSIQETDMKVMNDMFRAYGKFDVTAGQFSFFSELKVAGGQVVGYVKPIFRDMKVYDERQDKEKGLFKKLYEKLVGGVSELLENPKEAVATQTEVKGQVEDPKASTWQVLANLVRNAFFRAILPGFEENIGKK